MTLTEQERNETLKKLNPSKYNEGWRAGTGKFFGWKPTKEIIQKYKPRVRPCTNCGHNKFELHGLGVQVTPMWACQKCEVLHVARKK